MNVSCLRKTWWDCVKVDVQSSGILCFLTCISFIKFVWSESARNVQCTLQLIKQMKNYLLICFGFRNKFRGA